jgi:polyisoprenoid-binding protein YceI
LHSVDQVLGRDVTQRDFVVQRALSVSRFPNATFSAGSAAVPDTVSAGPVDLSIPGMLTVHGVTKPVTATAKAQVSGGRIEIAGSVVTNMADFGIDPPAAPFVTVDQGVTIEFDIFLTRS